jgi:hypothetical protein
MLQDHHYEDIANHVKRTAGSEYSIVRQVCNTLVTLLQHSCNSLLTLAPVAP